jgi:ABC-type sugar transport system permease subunit
MKRLTLNQQRALQGILFIFPWLLGFGVFVAKPFVDSFIISFNTVDMMAGFSLKFVAWQNYVEAFTIDANFVPTLLKTVRDMAVNVPVILTFALFTAFLTNQKLVGRTFFRGVFFLPVVIASGLVVEQLFKQGAGELGGASDTLTALNLPGLITMYLGPFAETVNSLLSRINLVLWSSGIQILLFLSGLQGISSTQYEAARCDGATDWEMFWKITLPNLTPILLVTIIYSIVDSFTDKMNPMLNLIKNYAFTGQFRLGYAAAAGWVYFLVIFLIIMVVVISSRWWVFYSGQRD